MGQCLHKSQPSNSLQQHRLSDTLHQVQEQQSFDPQPHSGRITTKFSRFPHDDTVISASEDGFIDFHENLSPTCTNISTQCIQASILSDTTSVACNERHLVAGFRNGDVQVYQKRENSAGFLAPEERWQKIHSQTNAHKFSIFSMELNPALPQFISGGRDQTTRLWDLNQCRIISEKHIPRNLINDSCWITEESFIQVGEDKKIRQFDARDMSNPVASWSNMMIITSCDVRPDSTCHQFMVTQKGSTSACSIFVHDTRKPGEVVRELTGHEQGIICGRYLSKNIICSASNDRTVRVWHDNGDGAQLSISSAPTAMTMFHGDAVISCMEGNVTVHQDKDDERWMIERW